VVGENHEDIITPSDNVIGLEVPLVIPEVPNNVALVGAIELFGANVVLAGEDLQKPTENEDGGM
jgi:hypothetical protein